MTITEKLAQQQLDAYNARDITAFAMCYSEDVQLFRLQSGEVFCQGREQLVEIYGKLFSEKPALHCLLKNRIVCGEIAMDEEVVSGLIEHDTVHAVAIYEVKESLIVRAWFVRAL